MMRKIIGRRQAGIARCFVLLMIVLGALFSAAVPVRSAPSNCDPDFPHSDAAIGRICMPAEGRWNGDLVVFAHGYVASNEPIAIPEDQLHIDGKYVPDIVNLLGFAFATTSYSDNGLAMGPALVDLQDLVLEFTARKGAPGRVYLVGASEGGITTALAIERHSDVFDGGIAACGPVGSFCGQINYYGDARVLFDYFFPQVIPGSPVEIPQELIDNWEAYEAQIRNALNADPHATEQLLQVARIPTDPQDPDSGVDAIAQLLWYGAFATNDAVAKLGGQPFGNRLRRYRGSDNDRRLNRKVERFRADQAALDAMKTLYTTTGKIDVPIVTLHTLRDPVVPYWHELGYSIKIRAEDNEALHTNIPTLRYGHCNFGIVELLLAFAKLVYDVSGTELTEIETVLSNPQERAEYQRMVSLLGP